MKRKDILIFLLLFAMGFNALHAYAIEMLDTHACEVSEYVHEFSYDADEHIDGDLCHIHAGFHTLVILSENNLFVELSKLSYTPHFHGKIYNYNPYNNFLKPPILL